MNSAASLSRAVCLASFAVLCLQQALYAWRSAAPWPVWIGLLLPLLLFLPGMLRDHLRSFIWVCFVCLLYFARLVVALFADPHSALSLVGTLAVVSLFCSSMLYVRWRARELRAAGPVMEINK